MRCPNCNNNHKYSQGMTCGYCGNKFIFNPKTEGVNDYQLKMMIEKAGKNGEVFFTKNQLYSFYLKMGSVTRKQRLKALFWALLTLGFLLYPLSVADKEGLFWINIFRVLLFSVVMTNLTTLSAAFRVDKFKFFQYISRWTMSNHVPNLLSKTSLHSAPPYFEEGDIHNYGVEAVIIVDQDIYVDLMVLNNYHIDWKSVVISQNGYPAYLMDKVQKIIDSDTSLKVHYLHDADTSFTSMKAKVRNLLKMPENSNEIDFGISEEDAGKLNLLKDRSEERGGLKLDFLTPSLLSSTMGTALLTGVILSEALGTVQNNSNFISDFG